MGGMVHFNVRISTIWVISWSFSHSCFRTDSFLTGKELYSRPQIEAWAPFKTSVSSRVTVSVSTLNRSSWTIPSNGIAIRSCLHSLLASALPSSQLLLLLSYKQSFTLTSVISNFQHGGGEKNPTFVFILSNKHIRRRHIQAEGRPRPRKLHLGIPIFYVFWDREVCGSEIHHK